MIAEDAAAADGRPAGGRMRVALFITCFNDLLFPQVGQATVARSSSGSASMSSFPPTQTCCGQMHFNTGYRDQALPMVRRFVRPVRGL